MKKITINYSDSQLSFGIDKYKIMVGSNYELKHQIFKVINKTFLKRESSEYSFENRYYNNFKIEDYDIVLKEYKYYHLNQFIDLSKEEKLGSKSLYIEILESCFNEIEYNEVVNTIDILNDELTMYINEELDKITDDIKLKVSIDNVTIRSLLKQLSMFTYLNEIRCNDIDLDYNDEIIFQLEIMELLSKLKYNFKFVILLDIPSLTKTIFNKLNNISNTNIHILIKTENIEKNIIESEHLRNFIFLNNKLIDLANDVDVYENITEELNDITTLKETNDLLTAYLNGEESNIIKNMKGIL